MRDASKAMLDEVSREANKESLILTKCYPPFRRLGDRHGNSGLPLRTEKFTVRVTGVRSSWAYLCRTNQLGVKSAGRRLQRGGHRLGDRRDGLPFALPTTAAVRVTGADVWA